jgi:hypothetical protein
MGSSSSTLNTENSKTHLIDPSKGTTELFPADKYEVVTFRVKLPSSPIISKEKDEKYLFFNTIESIEKAKVFMNTGNSHLYKSNVLTVMNIGIMSMLPVINLFFYRRFRITKQKSRLKSFLFAFIISGIYYNLALNIMGEAVQNTYMNFINEDLMKDEPAENIDEYLRFKYSYESLIQH